MKLSEYQIQEIKKACESIEYGSVTINMNPTLDHIDLMLDKRIRLKSEPKESPVLVKAKRFD